MYEVIGTKASRAFRVLWMLEEIGQPYTHIPAGPRSDEARAANPSGKIPALRTEGVCITDSVAIMTYLADRHAALTHPAGTIARARQDALTLQIIDDFDALLWTAARHSFVLPEEHRVDAIKPSLKWEYARNLEKMSELFQGPFLMGDELLLPDLLLTHCLGWAAKAQFPAPEGLLADYLSRMQARPVFQTVVGLP